MKVWGFFFPVKCAIFVSCKPPAIKKDCPMSRMDKLKNKDKAANVNKPAKKKNAGTPAHEVTNDTKGKVIGLKIVGLTDEKIAIHLSISVNTLKKYYSHELEHGVADLHGQLVGKAYDKAINKNDTIMQIFLLKTRLGWKETHVQELTIPPMIIKPPAGSRPKEKK